MLLEIQHETLLEHNAAITEAVNEVRLEPVTNEDQSCRFFALTVEPNVEISDYRDGFENQVHFFNVLAPHRTARIFGASIVETHPRQPQFETSSARYPLDAGEMALEAVSYLKLGGPIRATPMLSGLLEELRPENGAALADVVLRVAKHLHSNFEYAPDVTLSSSPIDDVLEHRKGVCQDFSHLMIAVLRSFGIPARYVSGYLHRPSLESESHAWCEAWFPDFGWCAWDPTNDCAANETHVKVAIGRDYTDVPPNRGVYRGTCKEQISVRVETRELEALPALSWQEELPEMQLPLTKLPSPAIVQPLRSGQALQQNQ